MVVVFWLKKPQAKMKVVHGLIWVNGENFASLKRNGLLRDDAWAFDLPSWQYTTLTHYPLL